MKVTTFLTSMKVKKNVKDDTVVSNVYRETHDMMSKWVEQGIFTNVVNDNDKK